VRALFALAAVTKVGSYGVFLDVGRLNKTKKTLSHKAQSRTQPRRAQQQRGHQPDGLEKSNFG